MANYAFVENGKIEGLYDTLPTNWRNISNFYLLSDDDIVEYGWKKILKPVPDYDPETHYLGDVDYYLLGDDVYERISVVPLPPPLSPQAEAEKIFLQWQEVRRLRDEKMNDFQWRYSRYERYLRLGLEPIDNIEAMDAYMQSLADITLQQDPFNLIWPEFVG